MKWVGAGKEEAHGWGEVEVLLPWPPLGGLSWWVRGVVAIFFFFFF